MPRKPKRGRPYAETPRSRPIPVRFSADEERAIGAAAAAAGRTRSAFVRDAALAAAASRLARR